MNFNGPARALTVRYVLLGLGMLSLFIFSSCKRSDENSLVVFAAASTTDAVKEITASYGKSSGIQVYCNFASSAALAQQIQAGADADVYLSANRQWVDALRKKGFTGKAVDLVGNSLVVAVPGKSSFVLQRPEDLLSSEVRRISIGQPDSVPAGIYARQALTKLGIWKDLEPKLVFTFDVRQALVYVETGEVDAGLVYATDAAISPKVRVACVFPAGLSDPIRYPLVLLRRARPKAEDLFRFFSSPSAMKILEKYGFQPLETEPANGS
jgi:molybdate transport system substrate-binding protein